MIFPSVKYGYCSIWIQLNICTGGVFSVKTTAIYTNCESNAIFQCICIHFGKTLFCFIIYRTSFLKHFFQTEYFRYLSGRCGTSRTFSVNILIAQFEWINSHLLCQNIHTYLRSHEGLWRTISTECRTPCVVRTYCLALISDIADIISGTCKLRKSQSQKVTELGVWTMIHIVVAFQSKKFAVFVCCHLNVHKCR